MKYPNKIVNYKNSVIQKFPIILIELRNEEQSVYELYKKARGSFDNISEYVETLDCLFSLNLIDYDTRTRRLQLCYTK